MITFCIFCDDSAPCDGDIGIVSLETEGVWRSELERKVVEHFHSSCWEKELDFQLKPGSCICFFCMQSVNIRSGDVIVARDIEYDLSRYYWFHRRCWDRDGIVLE